MWQRNSMMRGLAVMAVLAASPVPPSAQAQGQGLSDKTITIVAPFTAGTGIDILARVIGEELQQRWGQTVVVENRPGASGNIGTQYAASRAPDGHTLMMTVSTFVMNVSLFKSIPYDPQKPFVASGLRLGTPILTTRGMGSGEMKKIAGFIADVLRKKDDGTINYVRREVSKLCKKFPHR